MGWGSLSSAQQILVRLYMMGGPEYEARMVKAGLATKGMSKDITALNKAMTGTTKRSWLMNQAMFTARRFLFYGTIAAAGLGAEVVKLGFSYLNTMQSAKVAFAGFIPPRQVKKELNDLYVLAAKTPFEFPDIVMATRRLLPFTGSLKMTNMVVKDIINSLSAAGLYSQQYLSRATLALQHMFTVGRLTGQILYAMARDNIPMQKALEARYHATGAQIKDMVSKGLIPANEAAKALDKYMSTKGFAKAALKQATGTLMGGLSTFKDIVSFGAGRALGGPSGDKGIFGWLTKRVQAIDIALLPANKQFNQLHITLTKIVQVIDSKFSPRTHIIYNTFIFITSALKALVGTLFVFYKALLFILRPLDWVLSKFGIGVTAAKALGYFLGVAIGFFILGKTVALAYAAAMFVVRGAIIAMGVASEASAILGGAKAAGGIFKSWKKFSDMAGQSYYDAMSNSYKKTAEGPLAKLGKRLFTLGEVGKAAFGKMVTAAKAVAVFINTKLIKAFFNLIGVEITADALNPFGWIALAITAIVVIGVLYWRWKAFHDLVNKTFKWMYDHWKWMVPLLILFGGPIGLLIAWGILLVKAWRPFWNLVQDIYKWLKKIYDMVKGPLGWLGKQLGITTQKVTDINKLPPWARTQVEHKLAQRRAAAGATVVTPKANLAPTTKSVESQITGASMGNQGQDIHVHVDVDRKEIAKAVARANQDYAATR